MFGRDAGSVPTSHWWLLAIALRWHHDATHDHIAISKSLDTLDTPRYVVEYVVFHEMLHIAHPTKHVNGRRYNHTADFKRDEQKFAYYEESERWIERNVRKLKRNAKKG